MLKLNLWRIKDFKKLEQDIKSTEAMQKYYER